MKQLFTILAFVLVGSFALTAQSTNGPVMTFEAGSVDFGTIEKGSDPIRKLKFTNTGNEPLIIKDAKGSCGCTTPKWPKEPIMPGESDVIEVKYDTQRVGVIAKNVTITTNETSGSHSIPVKGEVKAPATQESVPASTGGIKG